MPSFKEGLRSDNVKTKQITFIKMENKPVLPFIYLTIDEDKDDEIAVNAMSLVGEPAIEVDFIALSKHIQEINFKTADKEKRIVTGPALIPNKPIFRSDEELGDYNAVFTEDTIQQVVRKFFRQKNTDNVTLEHQTAINGVYIIESWIVEDPNMDKSRALGFSNIPKGTWFVAFRIDNDEIWNEYVKTGKVKGFSIEGIFKLVKPKVMDFRKVKNCFSDRAMNRVKLKNLLLNDFLKHNVKKKSRVKYERFTGKCGCNSCLELREMGWVLYSILPEDIEKEFKTDEN
jgi:hypothetical protein